MSALTIVVPCYNEEEVLPHTIVVLTDLLNRLISTKKISSNSQLCFVDDGSTDKTWSIIENVSSINNFVHGIKLAKNKGHQNALLAGLLNVKGDAVVSIDADLQDDTDVIEKMIDHFNAGIDIVFGVREDRKTDTVFKRNSANIYYKLLGLLGVDIVFNHADYRLMNRKALNALIQYQEVNIFLRGVVIDLGFSTEIVKYSRQSRVAGESKYPLRKMVSLAIDGITSFSSKPLRIVALAGALIFLITVFLSLWVLWIKVISNEIVPGWASSVLPIYFLGGVQLLSIGLLGEYLSKIYMEVKGRPRYIVDKEI